MADSTSTSSGIHLWLVLMKAHRSLARHAAQSVAASGLGLSDFAILEMLLHKGPQSVNEIGRRVGLTSGSISSAIDRLEARELLVRGAHATDRRTRVVRLTPLGTKEITKVFALHTKALNEAADGLSKSERGALTQLLKKLGTTADERFVAEGSDR